MLPYNDVWVVTEDCGEYDLVRGVFSTDHLAQSFIFMLKERDEYASYQMTSYKLNSMGV